ncbi:MAG: TIGR03557 family F420-dependent LLM class oxidoreductase [Chloroflexota bacterium]|nr:MAG: TIGR03557 family F420-dependent LLM class oxidoreductase [Chloroflexota bacterium]
MIGYCAMTEQFHPTDLVRWSKLAEEAGFGGVMVSDHFHPWVPSQGHSAFAWALMGAIGQATGKVTFGPGVTPPGYRYHPAIVAQAAATLAAMYPGRFWLGLGAGEALNEHIIGEYWPEAPTRLDRLVDSIAVIQKLFTGKVIKHKSEHFNIESARLYTLPEKPPPMYVATSGPIMSERTGKLCDGIIMVGAGEDRVSNLLARFEKGAREAGKDPSTMPRLMQIHVSLAETREACIEQAVREWPTGGMSFPKQDIRNPEDFEVMRKLVRPEDFRNRVLMTPDLDEHVAEIQKYVDFGFTEIYIHQVGKDQAAFIEAYAKDVLPKVKWPAK